jgi:hypothetical protein
MFAGLTRLWTRERIATLAGFADFLDRHAAMITHRSVIGYVQVKTRMPLHEIAREAPFRAAFERSRTEAYAAILADLLVVAEGVLREAAPGPLVEGLVRVYAELLARQSLPAHRPEGWDEATAALRARLAAAATAPPARVAEVARRSAERVYETLPIHESLRAADAPAIRASIQFLMVSLYAEFERRLDRAALARALAA